MTATVYRLDDYRPDPLSVLCPQCEAPPGRRCTLGVYSPIIRLGGPHQERIAAAEAAHQSRRE
ncbi:zinc finger domain-containing protein [Nocardia vulneris]|uniref:zinc finger domain-containing protein n=1 Tax=Nocardia vulneris TaxID=1141657 RepID=UPI000A48B8E6|nr:hypothetical protein [Nocardia vulneris]